ncbi:MAG: hypothetical protein Q4G68_09125, partial [Planctomycetia bacterium]|nr:hypothetical protein [Planctomycetia bacterium]
MEVYFAQNGIVFSVFLCIIANSRIIAGRLDTASIIIHVFPVVPNFLYTKEKKHEEEHQNRSRANVNLRGGGDLGPQRKSLLRKILAFTL